VLEEKRGGGPREPSLREKEKKTKKKPPRSIFPREGGGDKEGISCRVEKGG